MQEESAENRADPDADQHGHRVEGAKGEAEDGFFRLIFHAPIITYPREDARPKSKKRRKTFRGNGSHIWVARGLYV